MREICHFNRFLKILQTKTDGIMQFPPEHMINGQKENDTNLKNQASMSNYVIR